MPVSVKKKLCCKPLPCSPAAETAIQSLVWYFENCCSRLSSFPEECFFTDNGVTEASLANARGEACESEDSQRCTPNLPTVPRLSLLRLLDSNFLGNSLWPLEFHPLRSRFRLSQQSNPLKSRIFVRRLAVGLAGRQ